jgi:hypothetical protein
MARLEVGNDSSEGNCTWAIAIELTAVRWRSADFQLWRFKVGTIIGNNE